MAAPQGSCDAGVHIEEDAMMNQQRNKNLRLGFVPTMGALHDGHLSLVDIVQKASDGVIISIL